MISNYTSTTQTAPAIAENKGVYAIAWTSDKQDGNYDGVYAQLLYANSTKIRGEFRVNDITGGYQNKVKIVPYKNNFIFCYLAPLTAT